MAPTPLSALAVQRLQPNFSPNSRSNLQVSIQNISLLKTSFLPYILLSLGSSSKPIAGHPFGPYCSAYALAVKYMQNIMRGFIPITASEDYVAEIWTPAARSGAFGSRLPSIFDRV